MTRYFTALALHKGNLPNAANYAREKWGLTTPEVHILLRSAVEAGDTTTSGWASQLAKTTPGQELLAFLDSASVFNRLAPSMRQLPFVQPTPIETVPFAAEWFTEAGATPVSRMTLASTNASLDYFKLGTIVVFSEELARLSSPGAEEEFRSRFVEALAKVVDGQFLGPTISAISLRRPASITNGGTQVVSTGSTAAAVLANLTSMMAGLTSWGAARWIIPTSTAAYMGTLMTSGGSIQFPNCGANGGELFGIPVLTTTNISGFIVLLDARSILYARDPIAIQGSNETALEMDTQPSEGESSPVSSITVLISLFQKNLVALKAIQSLNYQRGHSGAVVSMNVSY